MTFLKRLAVVFLLVFTGTLGIAVIIGIAYAPFLLWSALTGSP